MSAGIFFCELFGNRQPRPVFPLILAWIVFICPATTIQAHETEFEASMRALIKQVILENPGLIAEAPDKAKPDQKLRIPFDNMLKHRVVDPISPDHPVQGPGDAAVTMIAYGDFQNPDSARVANIIQRIMTAAPGKIRRVFKHDPGGAHEQALPASLAAMAAHRQGKFWEYHDSLFRVAPNLSDELFIHLAEELNLDLNQFNQDRRDDAIRVRVLRDRARARDLGLASPPILIINGAVFTGIKPLHFYLPIIQHFIREAERKKPMENHQQTIPPQSRKGACNDPDLQIVQMHAVCDSFDDIG